MKSKIGFFDELKNKKRFLALSWFVGRRLNVQRLNREFFARDTVAVAMDLLGTFLVQRVGGLEKIGKIVEVEAYLGAHDLAAHSSKGLTKRTRIMFGPPGFAYVYLIYGIHHCMNVVTEPEGCGTAVLIRAVEPVHNIFANTKGPGLVCKAMDINLSLNGHDLCSDDFYIASGIGNENFLQEDIRIIQRPRIGVAYAGKWADELLRFYIEGNPFISKR
ncbi:DNA-3-methyladenine glycosylase [Oxalobacteraceae bacterium R-40]|uniref:Putative 3-methyladenine DNA glycosylase n=1 Tax=Keguizhuia sedimenti TaxID=3064264 RepID=A0ABU1BJ54_9BURK|nr:DNA-3-methyladenine glycosylase [Oxalobacteraceae bacterium R-40]